ncbi:hypothetical protein [Ornithinimicrobium sp. W1665]|uniref:hypothetical protein n=1 Tax=Ornithinimicrobium sp. W1665 TaxID=3416666 RepID=UPI003CFAC8B1
MTQMTVGARLGRAAAPAFPGRLPGLDRVTAPRGRSGGATAAIALPGVRTSRTRVVDAAPASGHTAYRLLCLFVIMAAVSVVLVLNTHRAEGSYVLGRLAAEQTALHDQKVTLQAELDRLESPETLAESARRLGMVPAPSTATLRLSDGSITGVASMSDGGRTITVDLPATGVADPAGTAASD